MLIVFGSSFFLQLIHNKRHQEFAVVFDFQIKRAVSSATRNTGYFITLRNRVHPSRRGEFALINLPWEKVRGSRREPGTVIGDNPYFCVLFLWVRLEEKINIRRGINKFFRDIKNQRSITLLLCSAGFGTRFALPRQALFFEQFLSLVAEQLNVFLRPTALFSSDIAQLSPGYDLLILFIGAIYETNRIISRHFCFETACSPLQKYAHFASKTYIPLTTSWRKEEPPQGKPMNSFKRRCNSHETQGTPRMMV